MASGRHGAPQHGREWLLDIGAALGENSRSARGETSGVEDDGRIAPGCPGVAADGTGAGRRGMTGAGGFRYRAHGLEIQSDFEVPEFRRSPCAAPADIRIRHDPAAAAVVRRAAARAGREPRDTEVIEADPTEGGGAFEVAGVGAFWVRDGRDIRVAPDAGADPGMVALYTLGTAMGLALFQRGALVLHGASVAHGGRATLILGRSGAGKSTLAARLGVAGCPILGDDTVALWPAGGAGRFAIHPSGTSFKLWRDALDAAGLAGAAGPRVASRVDKFYLANPRAAEERPHELAEILILAASDAGEVPRIEPLALLEAVRAIGENVYRPQFAEAFGRRGEEFVEVASLAGAVPVARLVRPWDHAAAEAVAGLLRARWSGDGPPGARDVAQGRAR